MRADGLLFDKDGTLFDFAATWNTWAFNAIHGFAGGDADLAERIADALAFDLGGKCFRPDSFVIAGTNREAAEAVASVVPGADVDAIELKMARDAAEAPLAPAVPLKPYLSDLRTKGLKLGVMTNDSEYSAQAQLQGVGVSGLFDFIAGFDSGYGAKPDPDPLLAFADQQGLAPERVVMVGDSTHDLIAGRRAGMQTVAVLTGVALTDELAPYADIVLPDIGHITDWLSI
ncbi:HAD family hydrolase [Shimia haliotis]|uniref:phosphoglycolate phosphatase n=1 Tax=Shimia haliotis TaxID=1280847 RepID=A0A1I3ZWM4_9RHOB|nr:HAD family hydrolase [Shimia haliotis]SFK48307.1 phosphoglycolate phosphatase [Shimia haliotis]